MYNKEELIKKNGLKILRRIHLLKKSGVQSHNFKIMF